MLSELSLFTEWTSCVQYCFPHFSREEFQAIKSPPEHFQVAVEWYRVSGFPHSEMFLRISARMIYRSFPRISHCGLLQEARVTMTNPVCAGNGLHFGLRMPSEITSKIWSANWMTVFWKLPESGKIYDTFGNVHQALPPACPDNDVRVQIHSQPIRSLC